MRIGLFGGTFDPIHLGHLLLAERWREDAGLDEVRFLPSYVPPHKADRAITRFEQRCEMVALATVGQPAFRVERIEKELPPPSYTSETLAELIARNPDDDFALLIGGDSLRDLPTWHLPQKVVALAEIVAVGRPGIATIAGDELARRLDLPSGGVRLKIVECPLVDIASRDIRARVREGKSIRYSVPRSVEEFIRERKMYAAG